MSRPVSGPVGGPPTGWRSVLGRLGYELPPDRTPEHAGEGRPVQVNLPLELVRQSMSARAEWPIPEPVLEQYRRYRPSPLWRARGFEAAVGARVPVYVKYEGNNISGSHKLNTALAQAYYYRRAGVRELVTGTGAGQWGTALAAACALFDLSCTVFMVDRSLRDKPYRGTLMRLLGAELHASPSRLSAIGLASRNAAARTNSLALAIGEAVEYAAGADGRAFCIGSGETYSILHQSVIGLEAVDQLAAAESTVDVVVGCVGAGSNFGGVALPFFPGDGSPGPLLLAAESSTTPKLTRGVYAYDVTDATGTSPLEAMYTIGSGYAIPDSHSAGLRFHGAAKLLSAMRHRGQIAATAVDQADALEAGRLFTLTESVVPAPESGHALAAAARAAAGGIAEVAGADGWHRAERGVLVCVSGHGYLDLAAYEQHLGGTLADVAPAPEVLHAATAALHPVEPLLTGGPR